MSQLKVLSYNVQDLPRPLSRSRGFFEKIGDKLAERLATKSGPDIVLLQEAFTANSLEVVRRANYPHVVLSQKSSWRAYNSGLAILSRYPLKFIEHFTFRNGTFWEKLTSKGVTAVTVDVPGWPSEVLLMNTHLQAYLRYDHVRLRQIAEIHDFIQAMEYHKRICIFAGDFNFSPVADRSFHEFVGRTGFVHAAQWARANADKCRFEIVSGVNLGKLLERNTLDLDNGMDHHFFYVPEDLCRIRPSLLTRNFNETHDGAFLSDHFGYEVHYDLDMATAQKSSG